MVTLQVTITVPAWVKAFLIFIDLALIMGLGLYWDGAFNHE